jgi:hypothetical protein
MNLEEVREQFDLPRLEAFNKYSEQFPPQHVLIASYFGYGKKKETEVKPLEGAELAELMAAFPEVTR